MPNLRDIVDVIAHRYKQVKEHLRAALLHLHLHSTALLEGLAATDDECEIVGAEPRVACGRVRIRKSCTTQDRRNVNTRLQALLTKSEALQFWQAEALRRAVDGRIPKDIVAHAVMVDCRRLVEADEFLLGGRGGVRAWGHCQVRSAVFEVPHIPLPIVDQARVVVALVQVFEDDGEDLWALVWKTNASLSRRREELRAACFGEPRRAWE